MRVRDYAFDRSLEAVRAFGEALQGWLFPALEAKTGNLDKAHRDFVAICATVHEDNPGGEVRVVRHPTAKWCGVAIYDAT